MTDEKQSAGDAPVHKNEPREGMLAWHRESTHLDPRRVTRVIEDEVWLEIQRGHSIGPFPAENYTYTDYRAGDL